MKTITIPTQQKEIITTSLNVLQEAARSKYLDTQEANFLNFDITVLKALMNPLYKVQIVMNEDQAEGFTAENRVDLPMYSDQVEPLTLVEFIDNANKVVGEFLQDDCEYADEVHDITISFGGRTCVIPLNADSFDSLEAFLKRGIEEEEEQNPTRTPDNIIFDSIQELLNLRNNRKL